MLPLSHPNDSRFTRTRHRAGFSPPAAETEPMPSRLSQRLENLELLEMGSRYVRDLHIDTLKKTSPIFTDFGLPDYGSMVQFASKLYLARFRGLMPNQ
jgi:hypothetical protein